MLLANAVRSFGMFKTFKAAAIIGTAFMLAGGAANATPVPAGTLKVTEDAANTTDGSPFVDNTAGSVNFTGIVLDFFQGQAGFAGRHGASSSMSDTLTFSKTVGGLVDYSGTPVTSLVTFTLNNGDTYTFNLDQSIQTTAYSFDGSNGTIGLYILGDLTATGSTPYSDPAPTALTLTLNETGGSGYSVSGTLANPPPGSGIPSTPTPEPASMFLMGTGLAAIGLVRRRRAKR
jgi:hypothetical protein